ncbi:LacI family DNA-binding transcriptional regulator [Ruficoccus amylovorans]|uniref:LacI family DNA-binding transcriptional regulator n=1 Tax=Ruficoccus amylovorans TaxID=1804625 RepID=A0A842HHY1_9BACT|nr:LacI family DNA-binding transcriptional regulator [Ruficoccus amylovorans]MBC2595147.1 LacI family DNA-binding transcriptional regulator [Ruficoccus amylovorans]
MSTRPSKPATAAALARHLGLSRWTVSRVLNGHPGVLPATVERVQQAMEELGYQPNALARGLRGGKTGTIGICFQEIESPILVRKSTILQNLLREQGRHTLIELTDGNPGLEERIVGHFLSMRVDGIVLIGSRLSEEDPSLRHAREQGTPVVWIDPEKARVERRVTLDRAYSMKLALEHLYGLGHRRFVNLGIDPTDANGSVKFQGLKRTCSRLGLDWERDFSHFYVEGWQQHDYAFGERLAGVFAASAPSATAAVVLNDRVAIGLMHRLRRKGWDFPKNLSIVSYDNNDMAAYACPPLTTIDQRVESMMEAAVEMLDALVEGGEAAAALKPRSVRPTLVERESTAQA